MYHVTCKACKMQYDDANYPSRCGACGSKEIGVKDLTPRHEDWELEDRKMRAGQPGDERSDLDPDNPVDMSAEAWSELYARNPDLLEGGCPDNLPTDEEHDWPEGV